MEVDALIYTLNYDEQNYPFYTLKLLVEKLEHLSPLYFLSHAMINRVYLT